MEVNMSLSRCMPLPHAPRPFTVVAPAGEQLPVCLRIPVREGQRHAFRTSTRRIHLCVVVIARVAVDDRNRDLVRIADRGADGRDGL